MLVEAYSMLYNDMECSFHAATRGMLLHRVQKPTSDFHIFDVFNVFEGIVFNEFNVFTLLDILGSLYMQEAHLL